MADSGTSLKIVQLLSVALLTETSYVWMIDRVPQNCWNYLTSTY